MIQSLKELLSHKKNLPGNLLGSYLEKIASLANLQAALQEVLPKNYKNKVTVVNHLRQNTYPSLTAIEWRVKA
jgi:hypothetical protein